MKDASQQQTDPRSSWGLCPLIPPQLIRAAGNSAFAVAAAGLGLLAGVAFAITGCHATVSPAPPKPAAQSTQSSGPGSNAAPSPAPVSPVDSQKKTGANKKRTPQKLLALNSSASDHKSVKRMPYVPQTPPAATTE